MKLDMISDPTRLSWLPYGPLDGAGRNKAFPIEPGLYRIRRVGRTDLDYIGQTGMGLRGSAWGCWVGPTGMASACGEVSLFFRGSGAVGSG